MRDNKLEPLRLYELRDGDIIAFAQLNGSYEKVYTLRLLILMCTIKNICSFKSVPEDAHLQLYTWF